MSDLFTMESPSHATGVMPSRPSPLTPSSSSSSRTPSPLPQPTNLSSSTPPPPATPPFPSSSQQSSQRRRRRKLRLLEPTTVGEVGDKKYDLDAAENLPSPSDTPHFPSLVRSAAIIGAGVTGALDDATEHESPDINMPTIDSTREVPSTSESVTAFTGKSFFFIVVITAFVQGSGSLSSLARQYLFKDDLHFSASLLAVTHGLIALPWVIKPVFGFISDSRPIWGQRRAPYFFIFGLAAACSYFVLATPFALGAVVTIMLMAVTSLSVAFVNVLTEALIVEEGRMSGTVHIYPPTAAAVVVTTTPYETPTKRRLSFSSSSSSSLTAPETASSTFASENSRSITTSMRRRKNRRSYEEDSVEETDAVAATTTIASVSLSDNDDETTLLLKKRENKGAFITPVTIKVQSALSPPLLTTTTTTTPSISSSTTHVCPPVYSAVLIKKRISFLMTLYWGVESVAKILTGYFSGYLLEVMTKQHIFAMTGCFPLVLCCLAFFVKEGHHSVSMKLGPQVTLLKDAVQVPQIWHPLLFMFLWVCTPSSSSAFFFFLTEELQMQPNFMGGLKVAEGVSSCIALLLWHVWLQRYSYRGLLGWSVLVAALAGLTPLILVLRLNKAWGIPDSWFTMGDTVLMVGVSQLSLMPLLILGGQVAAKKPLIEGTLYALLMSTLNVGDVISNQLGGLLTYLLGVNTGHFGNLTWLIIICQVLSLLPLFFLHWIPQEYETSDEPAVTSAAATTTTTSVDSDSATRTTISLATGTSPSRARPFLPLCSP